MTQQEITRKAAEEISKRLADQGRIMEGGWQAYLMICHLENSPEVQRMEMRKAFFAGAQHLWGSIFAVLEGGTEPTDSDLKRMTLINDELEKFIQDLKAQKGN